MFQISCNPQYPALSKSSWTGNHRVLYKYTGWLTLGLFLIVDRRPLTFVAVLGLGVEGGRGTGVEYREESSSSYGLLARRGGMLLPLVIFPTKCLMSEIWSVERLSLSKCMSSVMESRGGGGGTVRYGLNSWIPVGWSFWLYKNCKLITQSWIQSCVHTHLHFFDNFILFKELQFLLKLTSTFSLYVQCK